jgi:L-alanine-DL-glutamate epimerase-like enolase superfamily enzyme
LKLTYQTYQIPFTHPFTISKGTKTHQDTLIVKLEHMGFEGFGEATAIAYYDVSIDKLVSDLISKKTFAEKFSFTDPERYWHYLHHLIPNNPFLVCALDMAGWDLFGKLKRQPLHQLWQLDTAQSPLTNFTIGIDAESVMIQKVKVNPWPIYKVKMGFENDIDIIKAIRSVTDAPLRVDANAAWTTEEALQKIKILHDLNVELVEQPLAKDNWEGMKILYQNSPIPLIADESCVFEHDVEKCVEHFHGINIKLTKCSGTTPARRMIQQARTLGLKIMLGCMNESTVGSAAIAQLSPLVDYVDNDGTLLQSEQVGSGVSFESGKFLYNNQPGLGIEVDGLI